MAEAAVHENRLENLLDEKFWSQKGIENKKIMDIITEVQQDKSFDNVLKFTDNFKLKILLDTKVEAVKDYAASWNIPETEEGTKQAAQELYELCILAYGATAVRPDKKLINLDFFLYYFFRMTINE